MITVEMSPGGVGFIRRTTPAVTSGIPASARPAWLTGRTDSPSGGAAVRRSLRADDHDV